MPGDMMNTDWGYLIVWVVLGVAILCAIFGGEK